MYNHVILLVGESAEEEVLGSIKEYISQNHKLTVSPTLFSNFDLNDNNFADEAILYLLYMSDSEIRNLFVKEISSLHIGIISNERCPYAIRNYGLSKEIFESIEDVFNSNEATPVDLLKCNEMIILDNLIIGDVHGMNSEQNSATDILKRAAAFFSSLTHPIFKSYTITTDKGNITTTAATGIMIFEHNISGLNRNLISDKISQHDGRLHALILAPSSISAYLYYLFISYFFNWLFIQNIPKSIGSIASSGLQIKSVKTIEYMADGELFSDCTLLLKVYNDAVLIHLGRNITDIPAQKLNEEEKETLRVQGLPKGDMISMLISESVPFFPRAAEEDFKELFSGLRQSANVSSVFIVLMILSSLLATTGLFQNSAPVIIGAMILAPLMAPIISFSMGVVRGEKELLKDSSTTFFIGIATSLAFSCFLSYLMPLNILTEEMQSRLNPNILDLLVAIISGVAGAYAYAKSEVAKSLAGVAIAVALVPPLSVTGIGIGWGDSAIVYGSFLLFITNLAGITLAASLTFLLLGFSPVQRATKGIVITTLFLLIITVPLFFSFNKVIEQNKIFRYLQTVEHLVYEGHTTNIQVISIDLSGKIPLIYIKTRSASALSIEEMQSIKDQIVQAVKRPVMLNILSEIQLQ